MPLLELRDVHKIYRTGRVEVHALKGIDLTVHRSDFIAIVGPSGSGKTTLLNIMSCIDLPTSGKVLLEGHEIHTKSPKELALLRRNYFGFIFQSFNLIPVLTVYENVELALNLKVKLPRSERRKRVMAILEAVGSDGFIRVRMGVGRPEPGERAEDYVLGPFPAGELERLPAFLEKGADALECILRRGLARAMNLYNVREKRGGGDGGESGG